MVAKEEKTTEISTTDKLKMFKVLKEKGFRVELNSDSVPTVICKSPEEIRTELTKVRKVIKECRYTGSFGVRGPKKSDGEMADEHKSSEEDEALQNEIEQVAG